MLRLLNIAHLCKIQERQAKIIRFKVEPQRVRIMADLHTRDVNQDINLDIPRPCAGISAVIYTGIYVVSYHSRAIKIEGTLL